MRSLRHPRRAPEGAICPPVHSACLSGKGSNGSGLPPSRVGHWLGLDLFRRDINHVLVLVIKLAHLTQELLKLPTFLAYTAFKLGQRFVHRLGLGQLFVSGAGQLLSASWRPTSIKVRDTRLMALPMKGAELQHFCLLQSFARPQGRRRGSALVVASQYLRQSAMLYRGFPSCGRMD
jgi:hypothetical protein